MNVRPSYANGYARCAAEAQYPELWRGLVGVWCPYLGPSGSVLRDISGSHNHGALTGVTPAAAWSYDKTFGTCVSIANTGEYVLLGNGNQTLSSPYTMAFWCRHDGLPGAEYALTGENGAWGDFIFWPATVAYSAFNTRPADQNFNYSGTDHSDNEWHYERYIASPGATSTFIRARRDHKRLTREHTDFAQFTYGLLGVRYSSALTDYLRGYIGAVYFWDRAISDAEDTLLWKDPFALTRLADDSQYRPVPHAYGTIFEPTVISTSKGY